MKIKRFEASNMSAALRQIKKEFGEEAVILSAKTVKKNQRLLGKKSLQKVVVTAAIDKKTNPLKAGAVELGQDVQSDSSGTDENQENKSTSTGSSILKRFNPITKTGQKIIRPKIMQQMTAPKENKGQRAYYQRLIDSGLSAKIASEWDEQMGALLPESDVPSHEIQQALAQAIKAKGIVGSSHKAAPGQQKCVVMMGPAGVGKTCAVAKMAAKQTLGHPNSIAIISLDNQRVAGAVELERFSKIMGVPFETAFTPEELKDKLSQLNPYALIIIDTPGISPNDHIQREKMRRQLSSIDNAENLLLLNASLQEKATAQIIEYFRLLDVHSLFFTGLDWAVDYGMMINQAVTEQIPIGYLSDSPKIPEGIQVSTADYLAGLLMGLDADDEGEGDQPISFIQKQQPSNAPYYVANRNSDIFHFHNCKAVKRINTENMVVFKDPAEAMGQQFKPCRMCCSELIVPKPLDRLVRGYAGNRC
jgi:flagellar biosynthesis protein FlhF